MTSVVDNNGQRGSEARWVLCVLWLCRAAQPMRLGSVARGPNAVNAALTTQIPARALPPLASPGVGDVVQANAIVKARSKKGRKGAADYLKQARSVRRSSVIDAQLGLDDSSDEDDDGGGDESKRNSKASAATKALKRQASKRRAAAKQETNNAPKRIKRPGMDAVSVLAEKSLVQSRMRHKYTLAAIRDHGYNIDRGLFFGACGGVASDARP